MNQVLRDLLIPCTKIIRLSNEHGVLSKEQSETIGLFRKELFELAASVMRSMIDTGSARKNEIEPLRTALKMVHPKRDYSLDERVVRDLLDVCITLRAIEQDLKRMSSGKNLEAILLLMYLE